MTGWTALRWVAESDWNRGVSGEQAREAIKRLDSL